MLAIDLGGKKALVTGSARGIGRATALLLAEAGADVAINYRHNREAALAVASDIRERGREALVIAADVGDSGQCQAMVDEVLAAWEQVDIFVSNAGAGIAKPVTETTDEDHDRVFDVNVRGFVAGARAVLPGMKERRSGRVIAVSSVVGRSGRAFRSTSPTYAGAKAAIIGYVKGMALECGPYDITVNAVCPGWIDWADAWGEKHGAASAEVRDAACKLIPLGRTGTSEEVAGAILFLASDLAAYVNGVSLDVNGGLYMS